MKNILNLCDENSKYMSLNRRSFLKGALAVGGALALGGCGETETKTSATTIEETETMPTVPAQEEAVNLVTHN